MGVLGQSRDQGAAAVLPNMSGPVDKTGFFQNIEAGFHGAIAGTHSTRVGDAIYQKRYYDQIIQALEAEGEQGEDTLDMINGAKVKRSFRNPFVSSPWQNLTNSAHNPLADLYGGGDRAEMQQIWAGVDRVRQHKPDFLKQFANPGSLDALATAERQKEIAASQAITARASTAGSIGGFVGGMGGSLMSMDPENTVGGFGTAAGKTVARTVIKRATEGAAANAVAAGVALPGQYADAEHLGEKMTPGDAFHQVLTSAAIGAGLGGVHAAAPHVVEGVKAGAAAAVAHAPAPVREAVAAASLRAGTVKDRSLLMEYRRLHNPYAVVGDISTPEERSAGHVLQRDVEVREASPFTPEADAPHQGRLDAIANDLGVDLSAHPVPSPAPVQTPTVRDQSASGSTRRPAAYAEATVHAEGKDARNPESTADGYGQFVKGTWLGMIRRHAPELANGKSEAEILALRHDKGLATRMTQIYGSENGRYLLARGVEDSPGNRSLAHFLGAPDAAKVLKADPATPIERLIDPKSFASNRKLLEGKSASQVVAWAHKRIGASVDGPVARADAVPEDDFAYDEVPPYSTATFAPDEVSTDASLMQYKSGGDSEGVTGKLKDVPWNPIKSSEIMVWQGNDGRNIVVDGHQRTGLAKSLYPDDPSIRLPAIVLREADGISAAQARVIGALRNIAMGTGSLEDNARVLRDAPQAASQLKGAEHARDIQGLANLNYEAFGAVLNDVIDPRIAAQIGLHAPAEAHMPLVSMLARQGISNPAEAHSIIRQALADGFGTQSEQQLSLLGEHPQHSLYVPIARILAAAQKKLRDEKRTLKVLGEKAGRIEAAGNVLDKTANQEKVIGSDEALGILDRTAHSSGPVRDALIEAARAELSGARRGDAVNRFLDALSGIDLRAAAEGHGRLSDAGEPFGAAGSEPSPEAPDSELSGSLFDRAVAAKTKAEEFSDPVGEAAKAQTASIEHDLLMDAAADPTAPTVYFHGSPTKDLKEFSSEAAQGKGGNHGIYFTTSERFAKRYAFKAGAEGEVYRVHLRMENPFVIEEGKGGHEGHKSAFIDADMLKELQAQGYDGIINPNLGEVVVFSPNQVERIAPPLSLFDTPETGFRLSEEGDALPIHEIMKSAESDEEAAKSLAECLQPPKVTE